MQSYQWGVVAVLAAGLATPAQAAANPAVGTLLREGRLFLNFHPETESAPPVKSPSLLTNAQIALITHSAPVEPRRPAIQVNSDQITRLEPILNERSNP